MISGCSKICPDGSANSDWISVESEFVSWHRQEILLFSKPTGPEVHKATYLMFQGHFTKWPEHEADHSTPFRAKNKWSYTTIPPHAFTVWSLINQRTTSTLLLVYQTAPWHGKSSALNS
jgi:hypothetical protein